MPPDKKVNDVRYSEKLYLYIILPYYYFVNKITFDKVLKRLCSVDKKVNGSLKDKEPSLII